jgi:hypothetical protein
MVLVSDLIVILVFLYHNQHYKSGADYLFSFFDPKPNHFARKNLGFARAASDAVCAGAA